MHTSYSVLGICQAFAGGGEGGGGGGIFFLTTVYMHDIPSNVLFHIFWDTVNPSSIEPPSWIVLL